MKQYLRKPMRVKAVQWTGDNFDEITTLIPNLDISVTNRVLSVKFHNNFYPQSCVPSDYIVIDEDTTLGFIYSETEFEMTFDEVHNEEQ